VKRQSKKIDTQSQRLVLQNKNETCI
jgi:hypothetical protein